MLKNFTSDEWGVRVCEGVGRCSVVFIRHIIGFYRVQKKVNKTDKVTTDRRTDRQTDKCTKQLL
jgi:hypothetical protein